jgi:hypothetical protein
MPYALIFQSRSGPTITSFRPCRSPLFPARLHRFCTRRRLGLVGSTARLVYARSTPFARMAPIGCDAEIMVADPSEYFFPAHLPPCGNASIGSLIRARICQPARSPRSKLRQAEQPKPIREIAWTAQLRLCARYRKLARAGKPANVAAAAIARPRQLRDASPAMQFQPGHQSMINRRYDGRASCPARQKQSA